MGSPYLPSSHWGLRRPEGLGVAGRVPSSARLLCDTGASCPSLRFLIWKMGRMKWELEYLGQQEGDMVISVKPLSPRSGWGTRYSDAATWSPHKTHAQSS